ncbi:MAG: MBL fold metallo-hydrolase [Acidobacteriota bacterium]|nr:MBL fold metallo-hydrolase [Acidobacteriota bacterium]
MNRKPGPWPKQVPPQPGDMPPERVQDDQVRLTMINHSTVLIQTAGLNIITDPVFSQRVSPVSWAGPKRIAEPGIALEKLPPIDVILISHDHYDHLDIASIDRLYRLHQPQILAGLGVDTVLQQESRSNARCETLDWWDSACISQSVQARFVPAQHFSGRGLYDRDMSLWGGFVIEGPAGPIWFAGDTGFGPFLEDIRGRYPRFRLALLPIGAYKPDWFMSRVHISPAEAVRIVQMMHIEQALAIHFGTFKLADDGYEEPVTDLRKAMAEANLPDERFLTLVNGEAWQTVKQEIAVPV